MIKNKKQSMIVIGAFIFILMLFTTTYAFFNYTRTGTANNIKTGKIYFNADQGNNTVTLSDLFPISVAQNETVTASTPGVGSLKLHITGDTEYTEGIEYLIEAVEVTGNGQTTLPISIDISYAPTVAEQGQDPNVIGTADNDYFINRGGNTSRYKLLSNGSISEGEDILVGYIAPGATGIDGELTILAYLNADNIAITDTYDEDEPETDLNGTTTDWINGRVVFTTEEWNALQATGVSFKIKATANEVTWVEAPGSIPTCPGCKFVYIETDYSYGGTDNNSTDVSTLAEEATITSDYRTLNKNFFLGFTETEYGTIDRAFACGINVENNNSVFCLEGALKDSEGGDEATRAAVFSRNVGILNTHFPGCNADASESSVSCYSSVDAYAEEGGYVYVTNHGGCYADENGTLSCRWI